MKVIKRNGEEVDFCRKKIESAITRAVDEIRESNPDEVLSPSAIQSISSRLYERCRKRKSSTSVEEIQDMVEKELMKTGAYTVAKKYILYRQQRKKIRETSDTLIDYKKTVDNYLHVKDWRVKENSTVTYSIGGLILSNSGAITANYWLSEIYDEEIANAHRNADIHIHDLSMLTGYCFTGDTRVKTLDGKNPSFRELVDNNVNELWVFAYDSKNDKIVPAKALNPRITRKTRELVEVTLCTGKKILCTPDHLFMLRNGEYTAAKDLRANMSLMPLYIGEKSKYITISKAWNNQPSHLYLHRWIAEQVLGRPLSGDEVVHHINGDKHDNRPENLEVLEDATHRKMELSRTMLTALWKESNNKRLSKYNCSPEKRREVSEFAQSRRRDPGGKFISTFAYNPSADVRGACFNHRVRKVKTILLDNEVEMYDLTVPDYENFALDAGVFVHNCAGWSLKQLIQEGLGGVPGKITSSPASHLSTLCNQMVNFLGIMQNEWAGAQAFSSFDTYLAPFVRVDNLSYKEVKQCIQSFIYGVNTPSRWGTQAPFTNITLDWTVPDDLAELNCIVGGKEQNFCYKDCQKEMDMVNKAFIEIMIEGDANGRGFQYPIPTYSITKDFDWSDTENNRLLFEMTAKYGTPYFSNYINSDMEPSDVRSMCCRLRLDLRELRKKSGGFFGSGESTGSIGVVTINMPRIAYLSETEDDFYERLDKQMDIAARSLDIKRTVIENLLETGLYPYTKRYLGSFNNHFSTIGLVGMNEAGLNARWIGKDMTSPETQTFAKNVLLHMRERLSDYQEKYGDLFNLEATPAESTSYRLAKHDVAQYPDIITAGGGCGEPYYTNSSHLPVGYTDDVFSALDIQDELQTLYTSGTVFHAFLGEKLPTWQSAMHLVRKIAENYRIPYYTISPTYSVCKTHGYIAGEKYTCDKCGESTEVYSRITGYYRPVQNWNDGKAQEFKDRKTYSTANKQPLFEEEHEHKCGEDGCDFADAPKDPTNTSQDLSKLFTVTSYVLVATTTCPNCKMAARWLDDSGLDYLEVFADENRELADLYGIAKAPTLLVLYRDYVNNTTEAVSETYTKLTGLSEIRRFIESIKKEEAQ